MFNVARVGDLTDGICYHSSHENPYRVMGNIITGSENSFMDGNMMNVSRVGDLVLTKCGHLGRIATGSSTVFMGEAQRNVARLGDLVEGDYIAHIVSASSDIFVDP